MAAAFGNIRANTAEHAFSWCICPFLVSKYCSNYYYVLETALKLLPALSYLNTWTYKILLSCYIHITFFHK